MLVIIFILYKGLTVFRIRDGLDQNWLAYPAQVLMVRLAKMWKIMCHCCLAWFETFDFLRAMYPWQL